MFPVQLLMVILYKRLGKDQKSKNIIIIRKLYGMILGLIFFFYFYEFKETVFCIIAYLISYFLSYQCTTEKKTFIVNCINFSFLTLSQIHRILVFEKDQLNISFALMVSIPRLVYFNQYVLELNKAKKISKDLHKAEKLTDIQIID